MTGGAAIQELLQLRVGFHRREAEHRCHHEATVGRCGDVVEHAAVLALDAATPDSLPAVAFAHRLKELNRFTSVVVDHQQLRTAIEALGQVNAVGPQGALRFLAGRLSPTGFELPLDHHIADLARGQVHDPQAADMAISQARRGAHEQKAPVRRQLQVFRGCYAADRSKACVRDACRRFLYGIRQSADGQCHSDDGRT
ncbi:hypothetical protein D9M71_470280 [compost metagenome]